MQGYIKLHRQLLEWEWYSDSVVKDLFIHLLLTANHKDTKYRGINVYKGQVLTGRLKLACELNFSEMQIRTALKKLKSTNEITIKSTSQYSIITINNWQRYQLDNQQDNQRITNEQPTNNQQITTSKNDKNEKNEKNDKNNNIIGEVEIIKNSVDPYADSLIDECFEIYSENCPDLCKLRFERRSKDIRELTAKVLTEIDRDIGVFTEICEKANCLKVIVDKQIDFKKMLNCYQGILNGKYNVVSSPLEESRDELIKRINARLDKTTERGY